MPGIADSSSGSSEWEGEALVRNLASLITTRSNAFSVWGVAQTITKRSGNTQYAAFQSGDLVTGEKRFHAIVERYVWPGVDGVAGNAQVDSGGAYNQLGSTALLGSTSNTMEATDPVTKPDLFFQAYNPKAAVMKYRVVYFEYLN